MKRVAVKKSHDKKVFKRTANQIKKVNITGTTMRGGIRM